MDSWLWVLSTVLLVIVIVQGIHLYLVRKSSKEILNAFHERLITNTNTLITISSRDRYMRHLASEINKELRILRKERQCLQQGNTELKDAVLNISHDIRTPLTALVGYVDLLEGEEMSEDAMQYTKMISSRAQALKQLTEELFQYSILMNKEEEEKEVIDLNGMLEESIASFYGVMKQHNIEPEICIPEERVELLINRESLQRILENIISNTIKYTDGDLKVTMDTKGTITVSNQAKNLNSIIVGRLFDRFYTVKTGRNSTGLGLSIARLLTEREGGTISASYREQRLSIKIQLCKQNDIE